jgi:hypothetical protein
MATNGGKFLRPAFFWLFASLTGQPQPEQRDRLIKLATSIEVLHMATLIHDDIIDDSPSGGDASAFKPSLARTWRFIPAITCSRSSLT